MANRAVTKPVSVRESASGMSRKVACACGHTGWYGGSMRNMGAQSCEACGGRFEWVAGQLQVRQLVDVEPLKPVSAPEPVVDEALLAEYADEPATEPASTGRVVLIRRRRIDPEDVA